MLLRLSKPIRSSVMGYGIQGQGQLGFQYWWSWGDLNPRPQAFFGQIYMFSGLI